MVRVGNTNKEGRMAIPATIRVVLVDDQQNMHMAIAGLLKTTDDICLVGQTYRGADAIQLCTMTKPDIVLMDVVMPGMSGAETTRTLVNQFSSLRVLALSSYSEYDYIKEMLDSGAIGYLVKDAIIEDLISTIRATYRGNTVLSPEVAQMVFSPPQSHELSDFDLTYREKQVLQLMAQGQTNLQIAQALSISQPTVRFHFNNILLKFNVETRSEALVIAAKNRLI
jgi:two-component system, NarL family, response regulator LiaR